MIARTIVLSIIAVLALFWSVVLIATWDSQHALFGWNLGADGRTLIYVMPGGPAWRAGLRAGDRLDWSTVPLVGRANLAMVEGVLPSTRLHVSARRGSTMRTVAIAPKQWPGILEASSHVLTLAGLFLLAIGIALVQLRPSRMTWGFLFSSLLWAYPPYVPGLWAQSAPWRFMLGDGLSSVLTGAYAAGTLIFTSRFPSDKARGPLRALDRYAIPFGIAVAALGLYVDATVAYASNPPPAWALFANQSLVQIILFVLALAALATAYALTSSSGRQRIIPVLIAFAIYVACTMGSDIYSAFFTNATAHAVWTFLIAASTIALAIAVAYGVVRHRVLDVSFAISRTVVYTILTSIVVGAFVLIDFVSSKLLEHFQITIALEALVALAFGIWLNALHSRIDQLVDRVLFRRRHLAEARLNRMSRALVHAESTSFIDDALVIEACEALALSSAAVFRRDGSERFVRVLARGWQGSELQAVTSQDHLVVNLLCDLQPLDLVQIRWPHDGVPHGMGQPLIALPLCVRHELLGFVLYGGHVGGEAIDPDEQRTLMRLADAAATAYEHVQTKALISETNQLRTENTVLQREQELLRQMIETRLTSH